MSKKNILIVIGIVLIIVIISVYIYMKRKKEVLPELPPITPPVNNQNQPKSQDFPLNVGSSGVEVKRLQMALNRINKDFKIAEDGNFGNDTKTKLLLSVPVRLSKLPMDSAQLTEIIKIGNSSK